MKDVLMVMSVMMLVMLIIVVLVAYKMKMYDNIVSVYECGFDSMCKTRKVFSFRFFLIGVLFLIFDVEIVFLLPVPYLMSSVVGVWVINGVLMVLVGGVCYELSFGGLNWLN